MRAAARWVDGTAAGNGVVGAVAWGEGPYVVDLDHAGFWDRRSEGAGPGYSLAGVLDGTAPEPRFDVVTPTRLPPSRLLLDRAPDDVRALRDADVVLLTGTGPAPSVELAWCCEPAAWSHREQPAFGPRPEALFADYPAAKHDAGRITQEVPDGGTLALAWRLVDGAAGWALAVGLGHDAAAVAADVDAVLADPGAAAERHDRWWASFLGASGVDLPDRDVQARWEADLVLLGSAVRADGPPLGLQGPWSPDGRMPPWGGDLHHNVNVQFSYAAVHRVGHPELAGSLLRFVETALPEWRRFARDVVGVPGAFVPSATDDEGRCRYEWATVNLAFSSGPWLAYEVWRHHRHTGDGRLLGFLDEVADALVPLLAEGDDGRLHVAAGYSPEWFPPSWGPDPAVDLAFLDWLLRACGRAEVADRLAPLPLDDAGALMVRADQPADRSHRHHSHLAAIHPLRTLTEGPVVDASLAALAGHGPGEWVGFSVPWAASLHATTGDGDAALAHLRDYATKWVTAAGFHVQQPTGPVDTVWNQLGPALGGDALSLESTGAFLGAVVDLLLQDHGDVVRLFPALPTAWRAPGERVAFRGLRAEGGWTVDAAAVGGTLVEATITAGAGGPLTVRYPDRHGPVEARHHLAPGEALTLGGAP